MLRDKIEVKVTERMFSFTLTESEVQFLIERLKYRETHSPDLTEPIWKSLEDSLGYKIQEPSKIY